MGGGGYLQTIESEEVMGTEGCDNFSQIGGASMVVTHGNFDDPFLKKSFV